MMRDEVTEDFFRPTEGLYRSVFEHAADAMIVFDPEGRIVARNAAARALGSTEFDRIVEPLRARLAQGGDASARVALAVHGEVRPFALHARRSGAHVIVTLEDAREAEATAEEMRRLRRVDSLGHVAAGVVHDFNNLLTPIVCSSALLAQAAGADENVASLAREIQCASERAVALVRQVLSSVRNAPARVGRVDVSNAVAEMAAVLARVAGPSVELALALEARAPDAVVDRDQLENVLVNLVANARDAMPRGGRVTIATTNGRGEGGREEIVVRVSDTGVGMPPHVLARVFERFFTTKQSVGGLGLGLAAARRFVEQSGGSISVRSEPAHGTTVAIHLPCAEGADGAGEASRPDSGPLPARSPGGRILVVEDDDAVRRAVRAVLEEDGYAVLDASSAEDARRIVDGEARIDLLLVDVVLATRQRSGCALVTELEAAGKKPNVLFMSGHGERTLRDYGIDESRHALLRKAFSPAELLRAVRRALARAARG